MTYEGFNVEALRGHDGGDVFGAEGAQDGGLAGVVEAEHEDACLTLLLLECAQLTKETHN